QSSQLVVNGASDVPGRISSSRPVAEGSAGGQPANGTEPSRSTVQPPRFTLSNAIASLGPASADPWQRKIVSVESSAFAQRGYGGRRRGDRNRAAAALVLGAVASITGTAVLVYANRPECSTN